MLLPSTLLAAAVIEVAARQAEAFGDADDETRSFNSRRLAHVVFPRSQPVLAASETTATGRTATTINTRQEGRVQHCPWPSVDLPRLFHLRRRIRVALSHLIGPALLSFSFLPCLLPACLLLAENPQDLQKKGTKRTSNKGGMMRANNSGPKTSPFLPSFTQGLH